MILISSSTCGCEATGEMAVADRRAELGDRNEVLLEEVRMAIGGHRCAIAVIDVTKEPDLGRLVTLTPERFGRVDIAVNSAGIGTLRPVRNHPAESWRAVIDVSLTGSSSR